MPTIVEINGGIPRVMDYASMRQQEDARGALQQANMNTIHDERANEQQLTVQEQENAQQLNLDIGADSEGGVFYEGDGGRKRKEKEKETGKDGKVVMKHPNGGFDMRI